MPKLQLLSSAALLALLAQPGLAANTASDAAVAFVADALAELDAQPQLWRAIRASNAAHAALGEDEILQLDADWRAEISLSARPTVDPVLDSGASAALRDIVDGSDGRMTEIIVMDVQGLNAAVSAVTSDYWQGDEAKFTATFGQPAGTMHVSEIEFDESSQSYQMQVSVPLFDPASGVAVGAATFGLNAEAF